MSTSTSHGYNVGHPWYYVLGGAPLMPRQILAEVRAEGYRGYTRDEIVLPASRCEPRRSQDLRELRRLHFDRLRFDLSGYRCAVLNLRAHRAVAAEGMRGAGVSWLTHNLYPQIPDIRRGKLLSPRPSRA